MSSSCGDSVSGANTSGNSFGASISDDSLCEVMLGAKSGDEERVRCNLILYILVTDFVTVVSEVHVVSKRPVKYM